MCDGVVPFDGAARFGNYSFVSRRKSDNPEFPTVNGESRHMYHTALCEQKEVRQALIDKMTGR